jgi:drug/metabolite transporter (DMT)-like permease
MGSARRRCFPLSSYQPSALLLPPTALKAFMTTTAEPARGARGTDNIALGITLSVVVVLVFGIQDATAKVLAQTHSPFQVIMIRYWAFAAFSLVVALRQAPARALLCSTAPVRQVLRGALLIADIWTFGLALRSVPLAELQAISQIYPLLVTLIAVPFLGERVGVFRIVAVIIGFIGALVIVRPGGLPLTPDVILGASSAVCYAFYIVLTRQVSKRDPMATSMIYVGIVGTVLSTAVGVFYWTPFAPRELLLIAVLMVTMVAGHGLMMRALALAPASVLQPFNYLSLPWGITLSFVVFGHLIDPVSLAGVAIIAGAGLAVMARERRKATMRPANAEVLAPRE